MADIERRWPDNAAGRFYVDQDCIDCDLCRSNAARNFARSDEGYSYVARQPATPDEEADCRQALEDCPVNAIGDVEEETAGAVRP